MEEHDGSSAFGRAVPHGPTLRTWSAAGDDAAAVIGADLNPLPVERALRLVEPATHLDNIDQQLIAQLGEQLERLWLYDLSGTLRDLLVKAPLPATDDLPAWHPKRRLPMVVAGPGYTEAPFHYRYASGREGDACKLSIASNASHISLYCFAADADGYVAERYVDRLPKAGIGKACVRFKKLADLDEKSLVAFVKETASMGFVA